VVTLIFIMIFMPLVLLAMVTIGYGQTLKKRAVLQQQRDIRDQRRFLRKAYLRKGWQ
jgi:hypothetical protein